MVRVLAVLGRWRTWAREYVLTRKEAGGGSSDVGNWQIVPTLTFFTGLPDSD